MEHRKLMIDATQGAKGTNNKPVNGKVKVFSLFPTYWLFPISNYPDEANLSNGEVKKFTFEAAAKYPIGKQILSFSDDCSFIWRHIGFGYCA